MLNYIEVDAFLKELGDDTGGMSRPVLIIGDDGNTYILKNQMIYNQNTKQWINWDSMFLQEVLVYNIAKYLDIRIPECVIVNIDNDFINHAPSLQFQHRFSTGLHFGSLFLDNVENNLMNGYKQLLMMGRPYIKTSWNHFFRKIENKEDIPKIIALDLLTLNFDRFSNEGNLIISNENGKRNIFVIDHGHSFFGPIWNLSKKEMLHKVSNHPTYINEILTLYGKTTGGKPFSGLGLIFRALEDHIDITDPNNHSFLETVHKLEGISPNLIDSWLSDVPDIWFVDKKNQISLYKKFLMKQKELIRIFISQLAILGAFNNHTGGVLNWKRKSTGTQ